MCFQGADPGKQRTGTSQLNGFSLLNPAQKKGP